MNLNFKGKTVLVTGGTRGIGQQLAADFTRLGAHVIATGTSSVDFMDDESVNKFLEQLKDINIDICVNNAGINRISPFCDTKDKDWDDILKVNLTGAYKICKAVARSMKKRRNGKIINVASVWAHKSREGRAA